MPNKNTNTTKQNKQYFNSIEEIESEFLSCFIHSYKNMKSALKAFEKM